MRRTATVRGETIRQQTTRLPSDAATADVKDAKQRLDSSSKSSADHIDAMVVGDDELRDGRRLVRETRPFARERRWQSWWCTLSSLAAFCAAIAVVCLDISWWIRVPLSVVIGLLHVRLFVIHHDFLHGTILEHSPLATTLFRLYGLFALSPASVWKATHDHHHLNNSRKFGVDSVGSFPVMSTDEFRAATRRERLVYTISRHPLTIAFGYLTVFLWSLCIRPFLTNPRRHLDGGIAALFHIGLVAVLGYFRPDIMVLVFIIPYTIACALGAYLFYAQHTFPGAKLRVEDEWDYVFAALRSSSLIKMNPVMQWFTANIGYHHIHHLNAHIPFYRLPEAMHAFKELQSPTTTSLRPGDIAQCLRLNLWDPEKDSFVSFAEEREARTQAQAAGQSTED